MVWKIGVVAVVWLVFITGSHYWLNTDHDHRRIVTMGYMPVISNLAAPILDYASRNEASVRFKAMKFASFAEMAEALRGGKIDVAFIIAPLSIVMRQQGADVKIVYIGNRHESTMVARKSLKFEKFTDLVGHTVAVPMRYSGHNLSILDLLNKKGLKGMINVVEMNPPDMASALAAGTLDAYYVGEPFAAQTLKSGDAKLVHYVEDVWKYFICNLAIVRGDLIEKEPNIVRLMVQGAARSGKWARSHPSQAAEIASKYWNQPVDLVKYSLTTPIDRIVYDRFVPVDKEIQDMAERMKTHQLLKNADITGLVDDRFAKAAKLENVDKLESILHN